MTFLENQSFLIEISVVDRIYESKSMNIELQEKKIVFRHFLRIKAFMWKLIYLNEFIKKLRLNIKLQTWKHWIRD